MRYFIDIDAAMQDSLVKMYGGLTNLIAAIVGAVLIVSASIYYVQKEFKKLNWQN